MLPKIVTGAKSGIGTSPVQLVNTTTNVLRGVWLRADPANTDKVYFGQGKNVTKGGTSDATDGYPLVASDTGGVFVQIIDLSLIWLVSPSSGQRVFYCAE